MDGSEVRDVDCGPFGEEAPRPPPWTAGKGGPPAAGVSPHGLRGVSPVKDADWGPFGDEAPQTPPSSAAEVSSDGLRGVFPNPTGTTCYLGSALQALFHTRAALVAASDHHCAEACGPECGFCQLRLAAEGTQSAGQRHTLTRGAPSWRGTAGP